MTLRRGVGAAAIAAVEATGGFTLPAAHRTVLQESNGMEAYAGYVRLFGINTAECRDAADWNEPACWKFAWGARCAGYWCFGETAWGDQYAYATESLRGSNDPTIYFLDASPWPPRS